MYHWTTNTKVLFKCTNSFVFKLEYLMDVCQIYPHLSYFYILLTVHLVTDFC
jgi:hypothetical protein